MTCKKDRKVCGGCADHDRANYQADNGHRHPDAVNHGTCTQSGQVTRVTQKCIYNK